MNHVNAIRAALKAVAPVVAIPVEGRVPVCIKARLLKGALKGVTIHSVVLLENGSLKVTGMAGYVRTSSTFRPMERHEALTAIREWTIREREKRVKVINQGILSASAQRELKKKQIEGEADKVLRQAKREVEAIYQQAKENINPELYHHSEEHRQRIIAMYSQFRAQSGLRKKGAVIRWKLAQARKELEGITVKRGGRKGPKKTYARRIADVPRVFVLTRMIDSLEKQFKVVCPPKWHTWFDGSQGYWVDSWIQKRPSDQTCFGEKTGYSRVALARQLREARANIRALTPPKDEEITQEQVAA